MSVMVSLVGEEIQITLVDFCGSKNYFALQNISIWTIGNFMNVQVT
jgi:hypothetical protein